ncbi:lysoplasmalogenase family protein, partial [Pyxidicoccus caerfyrddinensis]|uniref:lysoplasmalogenase family protein n=1 Tax=Pyxidicoccus caerfyrddinensis TaxID=2709663 RepID=UPI0023DE0038
MPGWASSPSRRPQQGSYPSYTSGLGNLALPMTLYVAVICAMGWRAAARVGSPVLARRAQWIALAGALMFAASDGLLAVKHFVRPLPGA